MSKHKCASHRSMLFLSMLLVVMSGCAPELTMGQGQGESTKTRADWPSLGEFPSSQDLAILLPRSSQLKLGPDQVDLFGRSLLPQRWVQTIGASFQDTVVLDAFLTESHYGDWHIAAIRIVPCSPFGKMPSTSNQMLCWPGVRVVWQPTIYNTQIRRRVLNAYSDDRAIHVLYDFLPAEVEAEAVAYINGIRAGQEVDFIRFVELRDQAIERLLDQSFQLRSNETGGYETLGYRTEMTQPRGDKEKFLNNLSRFFSRNIASHHAHTVTAFSLPEGRLPGPIGLWTFVAFEARNGQLEQTAIEIVDPQTGDVIGRLDKDETVGIAEGDRRLIDQMDASHNGEALAGQVIKDRSDISRLADKINDPTKTMIANTSCGTCHNFNRILFDFHNLSYFEAQDITIAPRVRNDVAYELSWVEQWLEETSVNSVDDVESGNRPSAPNF